MLANLHQGFLSTLLQLLGSRLFACDKNALPGFEKRIVDKSRDSQVEELQKTSTDVASSCNEATDSQRDGKGLQNNRDMYKANNDFNLLIPVRLPARIR